MKRSKHLTETSYLSKKRHRNTTTLDFGVRAICMEDYPDILTMDEFIGFLYGMVAGNHDIDTIFIDSVLKQADISFKQHFCIYDQSE